jgi:predicted PurR-regulated permease PerM
MPRDAAIAASLIVAVGLVVLAVAFVVPILLDRLGALVNAIPGLAQRVGDGLPSLLERLAARGLLPATPEQFVAQLQQRTLGAVQGFAGRLPGGLGQVVSGAVGTLITLFAIVFVAVYLLADARRLDAPRRRATRHRYRHDANALWNAFSHTLSRCLGGLSLSPAIRQLEGDVLTPRIQSQAGRVNSILVFLAVVAGGELFGVPGVILAVPAVAVLRVLFDFFRPRLRTTDARRAVSASAP